MKLAVYQCSAKPASAMERANGLEQALISGASDLLLCPELFSSGYDPKADYADLAEPPDGPFARRMADLAGRYGCAICYGFPERADGLLYNAAALVGPGGALLANHRKRLPSPGSFEDRVFAPGASVTFADLGAWRVAIIICYEVEFPESLRQAALGGAQLVLVPTALGADWGIVAEHVVPTRAFENGIWLAYADHAGSCGDLAFYGGSRIVDPFGQIRARTTEEDSLVFADLSKDRVAEARTRLPYLRDCQKL